MKKPFALGVAVALSAATLAFSPTVSVAQDQRVVDYVHHYVECKIWLLTDIPAHTENCLPGHPGDGKSLSTTGTGNPPPPEITCIPLIFAGNGIGETGTYCRPPS